MNGSLSHLTLIYEKQHFNNLSVDLIPMNKTNHPIYSISLPTATANKAVHCHKWGGGVQNNRGNHIQNKRGNLIQSPNFNHITSIKSFDFSTLYTTIPDQKLKSRLATIIQNSFIHKNGNRRYKFLVLGREGPYFVKEHSDSKNKYTEDDIINMLEFLVDNIFVVFGGKVFQQIVGIPMGTNCAPLLADIFLYSYEAEFMQSLLSTGKKKLSSPFNFTYRYIDDVLSINNPDFANYLG